MTNQHRATPEQWEFIELYADSIDPAACILELRDRIEALEAAQPPQDKMDRLIAIDRDDPGNSPVATDTFRALCAEIIDAHDADEGMSVSRWTANLSAVINRARAALAQPELPPSYIDAEHTGRDQELLEAFYKACLSEGGTADEIHLRGLKAVVARWGRPTPQPPAELAEVVRRLHEINNPTPQPVAVSERLPGREGWWDEQGRYWIPGIVEIVPVPAPTNALPTPEATND